MSVILSREFWLIGPRFSKSVTAALKPELKSAEEMKPEIATVEELKPDIGSIATPEVVVTEPVPTVTSAEDLKPELAPVDLKPRITSVVEED